MIRRFGIGALALIMMLSVGGVLHAQAQTLRAAGCCQSSCPESQHAAPVQCCKVRITQNASEVAPSHHVAPDRIQLATLSTREGGFRGIPLASVESGGLRTPPDLMPSTQFLCSLQI